MLDWKLFAVGSAFFAGLTAVLAKVGVKNISSNLATAIRLMVSDPERMARMSLNARSFTLTNAPDSSQTYSTILHLDSPPFADIHDSNPEFTSVGV